MNHHLTRSALYSRPTMPRLFFILCGVLLLIRDSTAAAGGTLAGRWDLTIKDSGNRQLASWLELTVDNQIWKASFVGRWGNARPLPKVVVQGNQIQLVSPKEEEGSKNDLVFEGKLTGETLTGSA